MIRNNLKSTAANLKFDQIIRILINYEFGKQMASF